MVTASYRFYDWPGWVLSAFGLISLLAIFGITYKKVSSQTPESSINLVPAREVRRAE